MTRLPGLSRRTLLRSAAAASAVTGLTVAVAPASSAARSRVDRRAIQRLAASRRRALARIRAGHRSANGWEVETVVDDGGAIWTRPVAGSEASVAVRIGAAETVLLHVVRRWNYEVSSLLAGDVVGFRPVGRGRGPESDHGSGTAVDILPGSLPAGTRDGLLPAQVAVVRDILEDCEGVVRWGATHAHLIRRTSPSPCRPGTTSWHGWPRRSGPGTRRRASAPGCSSPRTDRGSAARGAAVPGRQRP
jgi:hypothetical protein